jgi:hypothetical protein
VLRVPVRVTKPGLYRLQVHAEGIGQVVNKTARIRFVQHAPKRIWQSSRRLNVAVVDGVRIGARGLARTLGHGYTVQQIADADLYRAVDPQYGTAAAAVLVDLATVPIPSLASLHALLPELRIVGLTDDRRVAAAARAAGVDVVAAKHAGAKRITQTLTALIRR